MLDTSSAMYGTQVRDDDPLDGAPDDGHVDLQITLHRDDVLPGPSSPGSKR